ncbi:hypothetical protein [Schaalia cardiffensis]|uniref:hypothetical protein n=1 Tax=Schaalia cardiffensis TaxID=181487 RepID=UPI0023F2F33D|nr:hypothetical protein [Schaalia cardiffensis]
MAATTDGYAAWAATNEETPAEHPQSLLRAAALLIAEYLTRCRPTTSEDTDTIDEAIYAQAHYWHTSQITPMAEDVQAAGKVIASSSLLTASMSYADTGTARVTQREAAANRLCLEARLILGLHGLQPVQPIVVG